mgnify:CR=1 FL=1
MFKFGKLQDVIDNILRLDQEKIIITLISDDKILGFVADLNRTQLVDGFGSNDKNLPLYVDDDFFKTRAHAEAYQSWKKRISPSKTKPEGVMDFYINGQFHDTIETAFSTKGIILESGSEISDSVMDKSNNQALGLTTESRNELAKKILPSIINEVKRLILT